MNKSFAPPAVPSSPIDDLGIGASLPRVEDMRFVRGRGRYVGDISLSGETFMAVVRSPHAAARIVSVGIADAAAMPGVLAVLTGADALADGLGHIQTAVQRFRRDGSPMPRPPFPILAHEAVHFAGDPVACVIAETAAQAQDAAERVDVDYEHRGAVTDVAVASAPGAAAVWPDLAPDNICFFYQEGDRAAVDAAFAKAAHVATVDIKISRVSANPMEPRLAIGLYEDGMDRYTLYTGTQSPHKMRTELAKDVFRIPASQLRVVSPDVGGGFGMKGSPFPEDAMVLWAARRLGRPVRWTAGRSESFLSDYHARDNVATVSLALDKDGIFLALRVASRANLGAYLAFNTPHPAAGNLGGLAGVYRTPHIHAEVLGVFTNTQPNAPYRGAGRPEATYAIERIIDIAATELGIDRVELRRRNLIPADAMPFKTGLTFVYDSGEFAQNIDMAVEASDWAGFAARRAEAKTRGKLRGISLVHPIEISGGPFRNPGEEGAEIRFDPNGSVTLLVGSHNHGQGHETVFRQMAHTMLGLDPSRVRVLCGDTDVVMHGRGTFGSRSMMAVGTALTRASEKIVERGKTIAAHLLEAASQDIEFDNGTFRVAGTDKAIGLEAVAQASYVAGKLPAGSELGLNAAMIVQPPEATFPNGCHVCEVEIDPETGLVQLVNYVVIDDVGTMINPLLVKGQVHGGVVQGVGQILGEAIVYDESGQLVSGSFMDYMMPRASDVPYMLVETNAVPSPNNPLGVKGAGEAGCVGALPAVMNAIVDALSPYGIRHFDMPATPARVWAAIHAAGG